MVGVQVGPASSQVLNLEDSLAELELLAETAGIEVLATLTQNLEAINSRTFIGSGKVEELKLLAEELDVGVILFDEELTPRHQRELEEVLGKSVKIIDRSALILDIFSQHARTREGMLQVELAQLEYRLPRLTRAWTHLARQAGGAAGRTGSTGGVGLRGPGETQLEVDRREIKTRIVRLKDELEKVREHRLRHREHRRKTNVPVVALVGYTNAGKSTLLNTLTNADIYVADKLFATLDPTARQVELTSGQTIVLTDTVGFIQKLPTQLAAAFRATLEEIAEADLLIHVVDVSHPNAAQQKKTVLETLIDIGAGDIPVLTVYNKVDLLSGEELEAARANHENQALFISARNGTGLEALLDAVGRELLTAYTALDVLLPYDQGQLVSVFHEKGHVQSLEHTGKGILISGYIPKEIQAQFTPYLHRANKRN
ncbi:MAG TPA: GTPase HflX [Anaerolineaceae bacterium]|nr:GTPase HflX [Anaerolineaceae bacterium]HOR83748.1 GTPase HflX [Anaerolineaceae bacterium]HPL42728.1 GTPase HflX [Anaerolineaceae bacterium]HPY33431.1 GTPase HflX [Anaerolineaceae bacterium]HQC20347.1 GTPase HflX [Anaerolineaceae bacterium]